MSNPVGTGLTTSASGDAETKPEGDGVRPVLLGGGATAVGVGLGDVVRDAGSSPNPTGASDTSRRSRSRPSAPRASPTTHRTARRARPAAPGPGKPPTDAEQGGRHVSRMRERGSRCQMPSRLAASPIDIR